MYSLEELQSQITELFSRVQIPDYPENLYQPISYSMSQGGKRIRPLLAFLACQVFDGKISDVIPASLGLEIFHNFTLLHDDIMDDAPIRRGIPTVYKKWGANTAILSGDTMFVIAYEHITRSNPKILKEILELFNRTAREVCEGQQLDMDFEKQKNVTIGEYIEMIRLKTAVLIAGSLKSGAISASASIEMQVAIYNFGINIGIAFQLMDDLLDSYGDEKIFGKKTGNDIITNKKTFLYLKAYEKADFNVKKKLDAAFLLKDNNLKVKKVTSLFDNLNIKPETEMIIDYYSNRAYQILDSMNLEANKKSIIMELSQKLVRRNY
ncbi:MAG: hypothetical protein AUJ98_06500 [Bacteroidetes bacterium CG2_30_33_31]|nr:MAG: hypothetical protein AUJ98_06500 [Bacteroidetes bacterium CG2_30_33_31]